MADLLDSAIVQLTCDCHSLREDNQRLRFLLDNMGDQVAELEQGRKDAFMTGFVDGMTEEFGSRAEGCWEEYLASHE